jgi:hypothetical protein
VRATGAAAVRTLGLTVLLIVAVGACASLPDASYKIYPGPVRPTAEIAVVRLGDVGAAEFDGRRAFRRDWSEVHLPPGEHTIRWQTEFGVSVLVEPSGFATGGDEATVNLVAGHTYTLRSDRTTGPGYRMYFWIWDDTAQNTVAGTPKP